MQRLVLLGVTGFIGRAIYTLAQHQGAATVPVTRGSLDLLDDESPRVLAAALQPSDIVICCAGVTPVRSAHDLDINVRMASNVHRALALAPCSKLLIVSSDSVYGTHSGDITRHTPPSPNTLLGIAHLARENILSSSDVNLVSLLRVSAVYGVDDPHGAYGPNRFVKQAVNEGTITVIGQGAAVRDHIDVRDVALMILAAAQGDLSGPLNVVSGESRSFRKIAEIVSSAWDDMVIKFEGAETRPWYRTYDPDETFNLLGLRAVPPEIGVLELAQAARL